MTEKQKYRVLQEFDGFETREYPPVVVADVAIASDRSSADNQGFCPQYCSCSAEPNSLPTHPLQLVRTTTILG